MANTFGSSQNSTIEKLTDCPYFLHDECTRGVNCKYRHSQATKKGQRQTCQKWETNECKDINCPNVHLKKSKPMDNSTPIDRRPPQIHRPGHPFTHAVTPPQRGVQRPYERFLHNLAFNMGMFKGSHVSVGAESQTPSVTNQLDAGISSLEIGVFSQVPGGADWRTGIMQPSATPNDEALSLKHWLGVINTWSLKNRTHLPLVLIIDVKDDLVHAPSFGGGNMLVRIGYLIADLFGNRAFWYQDLAQGKWPSVQQLCGRVIPVLSGSARARQFYLGKGQEPAVTANKNGIVVQVCNKADQVCYFSGRYNKDGSIDWLYTGLVGTGKNPAVTMNEDGNVIVVYEYVMDNKLMYSIGKVLADGDIAWKEPTDYDKGVTPAIAMQPSGKHFIEVHKSQNNDNLWYRVGKFDAGNANTNNTQEVVAIDFGQGKKYPSQDSGENPSIRFSADKPNHVEGIHLSSKTGKAWFWEGQLNPADGTIEWEMKTHAQVAEQPFKDKCIVPVPISVENKQDVLYWKTARSGIVKPKQQFFVEMMHPEEVASWPEEFKIESSFISVNSGTDPTAVTKLKSEGKVVRMNHCNDQGWVPGDVKAVANIITTDTPDDRYHQTYEKTLHDFVRAQK